jgi:hypothetical protein
MIDVDRYHCEVGRIYLGERFINMEMLRDGFAWRYSATVTHFFAFGQHSCCIWSTSALFPATLGKLWQIAGCSSGRLRNLDV